MADGKYPKKLDEIKNELIKFSAYFREVTGREPERFTLYRTQYDLYTQHCGKTFLGKPVYPIDHAA